MKEFIVPATFVELWEIGEWIEVPCLVNTKTREIVHVDPFDIGDLQVLQGVWVEVDGVRHEVVEKPETEEEWAEFQRKDAFSWRE